MNIVFGPIHSRRFGISLGIDLSPATKQCNFDCVYCELKPAKAMNGMDSVIGVAEIVAEIVAVLERGVVCDVLTFTANGEPTLYPHLYELVCTVRSLLSSMQNQPKLLILSNGSTFANEEVKKALMHFDIVKFSLDAVSQNIFRRVDKAVRGLHIDSIIDGIKTFAKEFKGDLIAEVLFVKNINDSHKEVECIANTLREISPKRVDLGTIDRPSAYPVKPVSMSYIESLLPLFHGLCVFVPRREDIFCPQYYDEKQIIETLKRRPLSQGDVAALFDDKSQQTLKELEQRGVVCVQDAGGILFYRSS